MKRIILLTLIIGLLAGCGFWNRDVLDENAVSPLPAAALLIDAAAIKEETAALIRQAQSTLWLEQFIFDEPELLALLIEKAAAGVNIHILLDRWQTANQKTVETLKNNNISVQYYPAQKGQYQRVRYMVADSAAAIVYSSDWTARAPLIRRMAVKLDGRAALKIARSFAADWQSTTTLPLVLPTTEPAEDYVSLAEGAGVRQGVLNQINSAEREILVESIQISQEDVLNALISARQRGCAVRAILNPDAVTTTPNSLRRLLDAGVEARLYQGGETAETIDYTFAVFDGRSLLFAPSAWSHASFVINHETLLTIPAPACAEKMQEIFALDWEKSVPPPELPE
ncbi:MAG: phosphatidylserine/phosphatidylglycerophosphate/cardiolipin synthase family protein [Gracilibacteraceae bacterium]|jgi:phosphatidylserine/phosphatidylglycerophosphate/cardiolipin synthase-like enzyme|nr:phosphatidylserine/phosphatidylglycerophosphate/cardiolipin synthase family protein [Gracilibacteraceae bacterium]